MREITFKKDSCTIHLGLQIYYSGQYYTKETVIDFLQKWQIKLYNDTGKRLFAAVSNYDLTLFEHTEEHIAIRIVNLPVNVDDGFSFNEAVKDVAYKLMKKFKQNRILIELNEENLLLEQSDEWEDI